MHRVYNCEGCPDKEKQCDSGCSNYILKPSWYEKKPPHWLNKAIQK